jgi:hypothetical protein
MQSALGLQGSRNHFRRICRSAEREFDHDLVGKRFPQRHKFVQEMQRALSLAGLLVCVYAHLKRLWKIRSLISASHSQYFINSSQTLFNTSALDVDKALQTASDDRRPPDPGNAGEASSLFSVGLCSFNVIDE